MKNHIGRTLVICVVLIIGIINIVPTVGWMTMGEDAEWLAKSEAERNAIEEALTAEERAAIVAGEVWIDTLPEQGTREARQLKWSLEDDARAGNPPGVIGEMMNGAKRWLEFDRTRVINLGLDLQGGVHMIVGFDIDELDQEKLQELRDAGLSNAEIEERIQRTVLEQVRRRVNQFEAKEPIIQALGSSQVNIQLPGEKNTERAKELIMKTAQLSFHLVSSPDETATLIRELRAAFPNRIENLIEQNPLRQTQLVVSAENYDRVKDILTAAESQGIIPEDKLVHFSRPPKANEPQQYTLYLLEKEVLQSGEGLTEAFALPDPTRPPNWKITFGFNAQAGAEFGDATAANIGKDMAIVLDDVVISAATIQSRITYSGEITGGFSGEEAIDISIALDSGSMVIDVEEEYTGVVGASLGASAIHAGVVSAILGIVAVGVFMLIYYRLAGVIAIIGLALNALLVVAAMAYFDMTLTLPGIAGLILTVGMAVDANVLIFERIREELRLGHSLVSSVDNGFGRATVTILDANVTTLIAAVVLMEFGTGPIEGFAIALSIGVCSSVFSALILGRAMFDFLIGRGIMKHLTMTNLVPESVKVPFLSYRKPAAATSIGLIVVGVLAFGYHLFVAKDMLGVDFTQGTNAHIEFVADNEITADDVRTTLESSGFESPIVQSTTTETVVEGAIISPFIVRVGDAGAEAVGTATEEGEELQKVTVDTRLHEALAGLTGGDKEQVQIVEVQSVGAAVATQLGSDAIWSMLFSMLFIVLYLGFRFEPKYALGAVVALIHDVFITVGVLALLSEQITMPVVAAVLTIIGYSLNDTIVVFDRIREDVKNLKGQGLKFTEILNRAISATLSRTLLTSLTTLFVVAVLFFFGGPAIHSFALALIVGVIVGTYSSIFIASPVVYTIQAVRGRHVPPSEREGGKRKGSKGKKKPKSSGDAEVEA